MQRKKNLPINESVNESTRLILTDSDSESEESNETHIPLNLHDNLLTQLHAHEPAIIHYGIFPFLNLTDLCSLRLANKQLLKVISQSLTGGLIKDVVYQRPSKTMKWILDIKSYDPFYQRLHYPTMVAGACLSGYLCAKLFNFALG